MKSLIVNADDFGLTTGVSRGILEAHHRGIVTSTTLLANRPIPEDLLAELKASPLGVGLHLNLTHGAPISPADEVPSLVDGEGKLIRDAGKVAVAARPEEAALELRAQAAMFVRLMGRTPTHLDSHHHVGRHSPILECLLDLAEELGIPMRSQDAEVRRAARSRELKTPDHFFGDSGAEPYWSSKRVLAQLLALPDGVSEFMTHPGRFDAELAYSRYGRQREVEFRALTDPAVKEAVTARGIRLCHFGEI